VADSSNVLFRDGHEAGQTFVGLGSLGEYNVGQLVRERHTGHCRLLGFTTYAGTVTAADDWGGRAERKRVRPALPGSVEEVLHQVGTKQFLLQFADAPQAAAAHEAEKIFRLFDCAIRGQTDTRFRDRLRRR